MKDEIPGPPAATAVVLAAGRGTRLRRAAPHAGLDPAQAEAADRGLKPLVPIHGRPYLAYALHEMAEAGFAEVCMVVRSASDPVAVAARALGPGRLRLRFAVQSEPKGTAHAVLAAEGLVAGRAFVVLNADNVYPAAALGALRRLEGPGLIAFDPAALVAGSNIPPHRVAAFALVRERGGWLVDVVEKPDAGTARALAGAPVSMTCWRFAPSIFEDCRAIAPSPRGELELTDAVRHAVGRGERFRVVPMAAGVLDLSGREDIPELERRLAGRRPSP
jgi:dTDP-glucose pyrophosphorylase